jgi:multidrug resistance efflux pump
VASPTPGAPATAPRRQPHPIDELPPAPRKRGWTRVIALLAVLLVVGSVGGAVGYHFWYEGAYFVVTDNAQVTGDLIQVGSLNAGRIVAARFEVGQPVQAGQEMAVIRIPQELDMPMGGTMVLEEPSAGDRLASVRAPFSGVVVARLSHVGGTVAAGQPIYSVVDPNRVWIKANIEETKLARLRAGQEVAVHVDALGHGISGRVSAITPASAATFSLLPSQNASGNFVKVTQLVPVKILVDPSGQVLPLGTSATVRIKVREPDGGVPWNP